MLAYRQLSALALLAAAVGCQARSAPSAVAGCPSATYQLGQLLKVADKTDKGFFHNYTEAYERFFFQWKNDPIRIFEIGIAEGGSLEMWERYFPNAQIFGVDVADKSSMNRARVKTLVADQARRDQLQKAVDASGGNYDILMDDGGHTMDQQQVSLGFLFKFVKPGGYYVLEDVHTSLPEIHQGFAVDPDGDNATLKMIDTFMRHRPATFESKYMLPQEKQYLNEHVDSASLFFRPTNQNSMTWIIKKR
jgi:demethylmacrocin O-methyltransferase